MKLEFRLSKSPLFEELDSANLLFEKRIPSIPFARRFLGRVDPNSGTTSLYNRGITAVGKRHKNISRRRENDEKKRAFT
jgi:hypothetical protein